MSTLRNAVIDALDSSEARCPRFYRHMAASCSGLDGCQECLELAADAVLKVAEPMIRRDEIHRVMDSDIASANMGRVE